MACFIGEEAMDTPSTRGGLRVTAPVILLGAFLLFQVQPLIAKRILPWFGGSAAVWTACLLCFQTLLLAGYGYAHLLQKLPARIQAQVHAGLLLLSLLRLPIIPGDIWKPVSASADPTFRILGLLLSTMGLPYLMLSTTSPLLQAWIARRKEGWQPYRLFALSNAGSLLALLSYPVLVEPFLSLRFQAWAWSIAYGVFTLGAAWVAWTSRELPLLPDIQESIEDDRGAPGAGLHLFWVLLAFAPCLLLIAGTAHLCTNVAPIPFLWVAPLALYLLSFILCFDHPRWRIRSLWVALLVPALGGTALLTLPRFRLAPVLLQITIVLVAILAASMICHGELAKRKPASRHLTVFYFDLALGGALAGLFAGLAAPRLFTSLLELPLALLLVSLLALGAWLADREAGGGRAGRLLGAAFLGFLTAVMAGVFMEGHRMEGEDLVACGRNFYGTLRVRDREEHGHRIRLLLHGNINHGGCFLEPARHQEPFGYYSSASGIGMAISALHTQGSLRVGVLGLGSGNLLCYAQPQDHWTVYEINPLVVDFAQTWFDNLDRVKPELVMGDARLSLEQDSVPRNFDLLVMDAFSSDAIPVHLLTAEAFAQYRRHLRPGGVLAIHISNRYLDLAPVLQTEAAAGGWHARRVRNLADPAKLTYTTDWVLLSMDEAFFRGPFMNGTSALQSPLLTRRWTDDFSNLYRLLK
jgi:SAM-dependent methyltransferase